MKPVVPTVIAALMLSVSCVSPPAAPLDTQGIVAPDFGQGEEIPNGMGRLVIGRSSSTSVPGGGFEIEIGGKHIASVDNGSYVQLYAEAETYEARIGWSILGSPFYIFSQTIIIEASKTGYLEWRHAGLSSGKLATFAQFPQLNYRPHAGRRSVLRRDLSRRFRRRPGRSRPFSRLCRAASGRSVLHREAAPRRPRPPSISTFRRNKRPFEECHSRRHRQPRL